MTDPTPEFEVSEVGERIVFGFPGLKRPSPTLIAELQETLKPLLKRDFKILTFDVAELQFIPSQMLGFLISLRNKGYEIELINPSEFIIESLEVVHLDKYFQVRRSDD